MGCFTECEAAFFLRIDMNEYLLLDLAADLGYELAVSGADTYRVEDSVRHVLLAYGLEPEVAAIPGYVIVSVVSETGEPITRMRRIGFHGNNLDAVERLNGLSRRLCAETPDPEQALALLTQVKRGGSRAPFWGPGALDCSLGAACRMRCWQDSAVLPWALSRSCWTG